MNRVRVKISELLLHYEFRYSYLLNVNTVRCSVVAVVVGVVAVVVRLWTMLMLSSQAYTSIKRLACHWVIERVEQFLTL